MEGCLIAANRTSYIQEIENKVRSHYDKTASGYAKWMGQYNYYYQRKIKILRHLIPKAGKVLEVGCGCGQNLAGLEPEFGHGIDVSGGMIDEARKKYPESDFPNLKFTRMSAFDIGKLDEKFDTILFANSLSEIPDTVNFLNQLRTLCLPHTRIVLLSFNYILEHLVTLSGKLGLAPDHPPQNWLTRHDFQNILHLSGYEFVRDGFDILIPLKIPFVSDLVNRFGPIMPGIRYLSVLYYCVFRPLMDPLDINDISVTVVVPCKNEEENIAEVVRRTPDIGKGTEIIFVDDMSTDNTAQEIENQIRENPTRKIKMAKGPGTGKGAACRAGFHIAENDILMILDADMTVMPEALPEFAEALVSGRGEFINGSRLVYPLERQAMRFANILGNKGFALLFSFLLSQRIKDTLCGTKVIWRSDYNKILESRDLFGGVDMWGDYDWIFGAARHNLRIIELPIHYRERVAGETKMTKRFRNGVIMLRMCNIAFWKLKVI